jgi:signal peptidase II
MKHELETRSISKKINRNVLFILLSLGIIALDQLTKYAIRNNLSFGTSIPVVQNIFYLTYSFNTGASFGIFKGYNWFFILVALLALVLFIYMYKDNKKYWMQLSIITGGIVGNLVNRIHLGHVVDFIDFKIWPVFNIADTAIFIGVFWLIIQSTISKEDLNLKSLKNEFERIIGACQKWRG